MSSSFARVLTNEADTRTLTVHDGQEVIIISQTRVYKTHHVDVQTTVDQMVENSLLNVNPKVGSNKFG